MIKLLLRALTVSLLYTLVCSHLLSSCRSRQERQDRNKNIVCLKEKGVNICFPKKDSSSFCNEGIAFSEEQYRECLQSSEMCDAPGMFQSPWSPSRYYTCTLNEVKEKFEKKVRTCEKGKVFDPRTLLCLTVNELLVSRSIPQKSNDRPPRCVASETLSDERDCKSFYLCPGAGSAPVKLYCAPQTYFSEKYKTCTNYMTRSCLVKLLDSERSNRARARMHHEALEDILEEINAEDDRASAKPDPDYDIISSEDTGDEEGEPGPPLINLIFSSLLRKSNETSEDEQESWFSSKRNLLFRVLRKIFSFNDYSEETREVHETYDALKKQYHENEKLIEEMDAPDEYSKGLEEIIYLNNFLMKTIAGELRQRERSSSFNEGARGHAEKYDNKQLWLRIARNQISLSKYLNHLNEGMSER